MTTLYLAKDGDRAVWVVALIEEDTWSYVANTGKFHLNDGLRDDFFFRNEFKYEEIGVREAARHIEQGVGRLDPAEMPDIVQSWYDDPNPLTTDTVFALAVADLN